MTTKARYEFLFAPFVSNLMDVLLNYISSPCASCGWNEAFYTSKKKKKFFNANRQLVYRMRAIGCGASAAKRFCTTMNMPPPPAPMAYSRHNKALMEAAKKVAGESMEAAAREIHHLKDGNTDIANCGVSCDATWQRRGHSSMNDCITTLSMDTGKYLDVEVLSKVCHACQKHENEEDSVDKRLWQADHQGKCKARYKGSAPAMEAEGFKRTFERDEEKNKLCYTENYGVSDSKGFTQVENTYKDKGVNIVKKKCVGHVQKRVGTALQKLKKQKKGLAGRENLTIHASLFQHFSSIRPFVHSASAVFTIISANKHPVWVGTS